MTNSNNNETAALIVALGVTVAIVGGALWWLKSSDILGNQLLPESAQPAPTQAQNKTSQNGNSAAGDRDFLSVANVPSGQFSYGGSTSWAPIRGTVDLAIAQALPNFDLVYKNTSGSSEGIQQLMVGALDFAQSSRPLNSQEKQQAQQKGMTLQEIPVALEAVAIATHPDLPIPGLTLDQLKNIYTGKVTNWNQVGGPNLAIVPVSRGDSGTVQFFEEVVLAGAPYAASVKQINTTTQAIRFVSETAGAVYFASAPEIVGQCTVAPLPIGISVRELVAPYQTPYIAPENCPAQRNQLNLSALRSQAYPLIRPLYIIIRKDGQPAGKAGIAYSQLLQTSAAQELLNQAGFVALP